MWHRAVAVAMLILLLLLLQRCYVCKQCPANSEGWSKCTQSVESSLYLAGMGYDSGGACLVKPCSSSSLGESTKNTLLWSAPGTSNYSL